LQQQGHDFWADKNASHRIAAVIGSAIGGALAARAGGPNQFSAHMERLIAREDQLHQDKIDGLRKDAAGQIDYYDLIRTQTEDDVAARLMARTMMRDTIIARGQASIEGLSDQKAALDLGAGIAELDQANQVDKQALAERIQTTTAQKMVKMPGRGPTGAGFKRGTDEELQRLPGAEVVDRAVFDALSNTDKTIARKEVGAGNSIMSGLDKMEKIRMQLGTEVGTTEGAAKYIAAVDSVKNNLSVLQGQNSITASDAERMKEMIEEDLAPRASDMQRIVGVDPTLNKIRAVRENARNQVQSRLQTKGLRLEGVTGKSERIDTLESGVR